jgi:hypothetical protein
VAIKPAIYKYYNLSKQVSVGKSKEKAQEREENQEFEIKPA